MLIKNSQIPLFPLNVVLFPGMMLPLHIFEERYKAMIRECLTDGKPFGVVLMKNKVEANLKTDTAFEAFHQVGTTARITAVEHLKDGCMNLITVGQERFIIADAYPGVNNYLIGQVNPYPIDDKDKNEATVNELADKLRQIVLRYIEYLATASGEDLSSAKVPEDPISLAYLAGTAIQGPMWSNQSDKQNLLTAQSLKALMVRTIHVLDKEVGILAYTLKAHQVHHKVKRLPFVDYSLN